MAELAGKEGPKCGAKIVNTHNGKPRRPRTCKQPAGWGTDHNGSGTCKLHGGNIPSHEKGAAMELSRSRSIAALRLLGEPITLDPETALLEQVWRAAGRERALAFQVEQAQADVDKLSEGLPVGPEYEIDFDSNEAKAYRRAERKRESLVNKWDGERDRVTRIANMALNAGIAKRSIELAERQGANIFVIVQNVLVELGMPHEQQVVARKLLAQGFRQLAKDEVIEGEAVRIG